MITKVSQGERNTFKHSRKLDALSRQLKLLGVDPKIIVEAQEKAEEDIGNLRGCPTAIKNKVGDHLGNWPKVTRIVIEHPDTNIIHISGFNEKEQVGKMETFTPGNWSVGRNGQKRYYKDGHPGNPGPRKKNPKKK